MSELTNSPTGTTISGIYDSAINGAGSAYNGLTDIVGSIWNNKDWGTGNKYGTFDATTNTVAQRGLDTEVDKPTAELLKIDASAIKDPTKKAELLNSQATALNKINANSMSGLDYLNGAIGLGQLYTGYKNYQVAADSLNEQKKLNKNNLALANDQLYGKKYNEDGTWTEGSYYGDTKSDRVSQSLANGFA